MQSNYAPDAFGAAVTHASGAREALPRGQRARARASPAAAAPAPHAERKEAARLRARAGGGPGARGGGAGGGADGGGAALHRAGPDGLALEGAPAGARAAAQSPSPPRLLRPALCLCMSALVPARRPSRFERPRRSKQLHTACLLATSLRYRRRCLLERFPSRRWALMCGRCLLTMPDKRAAPDPASDSVRERARARREAPASAGPAR